jgi:hypothetical protein
MGFMNAHKTKSMFTGYIKALCEGNNGIQAWWQAGIRSYSYMAYWIDSNSEFGLQEGWWKNQNQNPCPGCGQKIEEWGIKQLIEEWPDCPVEQYPTIKVCDHWCHGGLNHLRNLYKIPGKKEAFINAAVQKMKEIGFQGYNINWEVGHPHQSVSATAEDARELTTFFREFSDALHAEGGKLSVAIAGGAEGREYLQQSGLQLKESGFDFIVSMSTYGSGDSSFSSFQNVARLNWDRWGQLWAPGISIEYDPGVRSWLGDNAKRRFDYLEEHYPGVNVVGIWQAGRLLWESKADVTAFLDNLGEWVHNGA